MNLLQGKSQGRCLLVVRRQFSDQIGGQVNIVGQRAGKSFPEEMLYTPAFESWVGYSWVEDGAGKVT